MLGVLLLLGLGIARTRPGRDVPDYVPPVSTTSLGPVTPPSITAVTTVPQANRPAVSTTTRKRR